jgi:hypothetical protein
MTYRGRVEKGVVLLEDGEALPDGTEVSVRPIRKTQDVEDPMREAFPGGEFWQTQTLTELAEQQGVVVPLDLDELAAEWPEDESLDDFLEIVKQSRF